MDTAWAGIGTQSATAVRRTGGRTARRGILRFIFIDSGYLGTDELAVPPRPGMYPVVTGELCLHRDTRGGAPLVLQRVGAGRVLAEASLHSRRYRCDASATLESRVCHVPSSAARCALDDPAMSRARSAMLAHELQAARARATLLHLRGVASRVDAWLALTNAGLPPRGELRGLADEIGVTPEALYRELAKRRDAVPSMRGPT